MSFSVLQPFPLPRRLLPESPRGASQHALHVAPRVGAIVEPAIILDAKEEARGLQLSHHPGDYKLSRQQGRIWTQVSVCVSISPRTAVHTQG